MIRFGNRPPLIRRSVPAHKILLVRNVVSMLSHPVISRARLYEVIRWSGLLRCAPMMRSKTRWCTVRSLAYSTGPLIRITYFKQGLKPFCPRGCKRNFLIHRFLLLAKSIAPISYFPRFLFQLSNFLLLLTTVIAFFFSIMWSLPFSRRIFVASTPAPVSP